MDHVFLAKKPIAPIFVFNNLVTVLVVLVVVAEVVYVVVFRLLTRLGEEGDLGKRLFAPTSVWLVL